MVIFFYANETIFLNQPPFLSPQKSPSQHMLMLPVHDAAKCFPSTTTMWNASSESAVKCQHMLMLPVHLDDVKCFRRKRCEMPTILLMLPTIQWWEMLPAQALRNASGDSAAKCQPICWCFPLFSDAKCFQRNRWEMLPALALWNGSILASSHLLFLCALSKHCSVQFSNILITTCSSVTMVTQYQTTPWINKK